MKKRGPVFESVLLRPRLLAQAREQAGVVTVEAPVGFGKTVLLRQLVESSGGIYIGDRGGVAEARDRLAAAPSESVLLALDGATDLIDSALELADHFAVHTMVVADRYLAPELLELAAQYGRRELTAHDLRFSEEEMQELAEQLAPISGLHPPADGPPDLAERVAYVIGPASEGWPQAAVWMLQRAFRSGDPLATATELAYPGPDADAFVSEHLAGLDADLRLAVEELAHFDAFTGSCIDTLVGQGGVAHARRSGAPLLAGERWWYRLPRPVSRPLQAQRPLSVETAQLLAPVLIASGGILAGLRALLQADCLADASQSLAGLLPQRLDEVDQQGLVDVVATLRGELDEPHLALIQARAHRHLGNHPASDQCLDECLEMGSDGWASDPKNAEVVLGARIDRLFGRGFTPSEETDAEVGELRSQIQEYMSPTLTLRLDEIDALLRAQMADPAIVEQACDDVLQVAKRWENLGHVVSSVTAARRICASGLLHLGRYDDAIRAMDHAHGLAWDRIHHRALNLSLSCRLRVLSGDLENIDPLMREASALGEAISHTWVGAFMHWTKAILAGRRDEPDKIGDHLAAAARGMGTLIEHETGVIFRSEGAMALAEAGLFDQAKEQLALIADRTEFEHVEFGLASAVVAARQGRRDEVDRVLEALDAGGRLPPGRSWRGTLEASIAADLAGDVDAATRLRSAAVASAERHGQARLAALLLHRAPTKGAVSKASSGLAIRVLGRFEVVVDGEVVDVPDGRVKVLLKLLGINEGPVPIDVVFDVLWPDADAELGRRRIKNVVSRLRGLIGADYVVRTNETLALSANASVDLHDFTGHAGAALRAAPADAEAVDHLRAALELYRGAVLPTDIYDDWASEARSATRARVLAVLDRAFDLAPQLRPSSAWLLDLMLRIDPADDARLLRVTRQALAENHPAVARMALERALAAAQDLGVSLDDEIRDLRFLLKTA